MKMIFTYKELEKTFKSDYQIKKRIAEGKIHKIDRGIYSDTPFVHPLEVITKKYPRAIFTMDSAFYFHGLTDVIPRKMHLAVIRTANRRISHNNIVAVYVLEKLLNIGKTQIIFDGVSINTYDKELSHQVYQGKRVILELVDSFGNKIGAKLDIGVHNNLDIEQEEYCFELNGIKDNVTLFMNSKEQMIAEKLRYLLKLGRFSTRYKDIFDIYYFVTVSGVDINKLTKCIREFILEAEGMRETNMNDVVLRLGSIFRNKAYLMKAETARSNWIDIPILEVTTRIISFFSEDVA